VKDTAKFCPECGQPKPPSTDELLQRLAEKVIALETEVTELRNQLQAFQQLQSAQQPQEPSWFRKLWEWFITH
jgi:DNA repair exonuclease SbcCD ATPase subunit